MFNWKNILLFILLASLGFAVGARARMLTIVVPDPAPSNGKTDSGTGTAADPASRDVSADAAEKPGEDDEPPQEKLDISGRINILILGEDNVEGSRRSDTILLAAVDVDNDNIRVLSIPRDTRMAIPKHGSQKINHAYAFGGCDLVRETLQRFLGIPISYYVRVDYDNFPKLVDMVGGVDIFVGKAMHYKDRRGHLEINIPKGKQRMNGQTALKYVRFRNDALGDIGRVQRQQQFLKAMIHKMYEPENLVRFASIVDGVKSTVTTDMSPSMILQLGYFVKRLDRQTDRIFFMMLPGRASIIDKLSYWVSNRKDVEPFLLADLPQLKEMADADSKKRRNPRDHVMSIQIADDYSPDGPNGTRKANAREEENPVNVTPAPKEISEIIAGIPEAVAVLNGTGKAGVGASVATHLQKMGVEVTHVGNAKHSDYKSSNIIYPANPTEDDKTAAALLAQLCGISTSLTKSNKQATYPSLIIGHDYETLLKRLENSYVQLVQ